MDTPTNATAPAADDPDTGPSAGDATDPPGGGRPGQEGRDRLDTALPSRPPRTPRDTRLLVAGAIVAVVALGLAASIVFDTDTPADGDGPVEPAAPDAEETRPGGPLGGEVTWAVPQSAFRQPALETSELLLLDASEPDADGLVAVTALDRTTGVERWEEELQDERVAVEFGMGDVFVVTTDDDVVGLDRATGTQRWRVEAVEPQGEPPVVAPVGETLVLADLGDLLAIEPLTGDVRWRAELDGVARPVVAGDVAYVLAVGAVHAVDVASGDVVWTASVEGAGGFAAAASVTGDRVVALTIDGRLLGLGRDDGELVYEVFLEPGDRGVGLSVADDSGVVLAGGNSGTVYAFDLDSGQTRWEFVTAVDLSVPGTMSAAGDRVVVAGPERGSLTALDAREGTVDWQRGGGASTETPAVVDPAGELVYAVFVSTEDVAARGEVALAALELDDGSVAWSLPLDHPVLGVPLLGDGALYLATQAELAPTATRVYAFS